MDGFKVSHGHRFNSGKSASKLFSNTNDKWDRWLFIGICILSVAGLLAVYESSASIALRDFSNQYFYVTEQFKWYCIGIVVMLLTSIFPFRHFYKLAFPLLVLSVVLLLTVFMPYVGVKAYGAYRWVNFGFINFQPAEFAKLVLIIYLSAWFSHPVKKSSPAFLIPVGIIEILVILEPDLGTAMIILATAMLLYFYSGVNISRLLILIPALGVALASIAVLAPYRVRRFTTFFNPDSDPLGASYQIRQILIALGSGGWFGVGIGKSHQKYAYLPEANTDSIFAIVGEEVGFIGGMSLIVLFFFILWRGFRIAQRCDDNFGRYLALGITSLIGIQASMNLASAVALIPLTGIPLPFVSYGGSSLIILFCSIGMLLSISRYR